MASAPLGAVPEPGGWTTFRVWAPRARRVAVALDGGQAPLEPAGQGLFEGRARAEAGDDYLIRLDGGEPLPDPCSRFQPGGVRGPSRIVDPAAFAWDEGGWAGPDRRDSVLYELHVGTFTPEGTSPRVAERLPGLAELGVTAIELMPVATFPGERNWGYDGLYAWAPHPAYGGPDGLAGLVAAAHRAGVGVILDVVYNHLGPGSEALEAFGPYLTDRYGTPWGPAMDFDGPDSAGVREWAIQNACMWLSDYRIDGLRVDAVHAIFDAGPRHVLAELCERAAAAAARPPLLIAESERVEPVVTGAARDGGWGFDAQWADDLHHALHALLTGERDGYYAGVGTVEHLAAATRPGPDRPPGRLVAFSQNHDQVGNRALGDRPPARVRPLAALWVLLSPFVPMLFMGEEYGERRPFQFFTDHTDPFIADATREGRRRELAAFAAVADEVPDPQDPATAARSTLAPRDGDEATRDLYRRLIALRGSLPRGEARVRADPSGWIVMPRGRYEVVGNFSEGEVQVPVDGSQVVLATDPGAALGDGGLRLPALAGAVIR